MHRIEAVLFDFGMVLSGPPLPAFWAEIQRVSGLDEKTLHRLYWAYRDDYDRGTLNSVPYWNRIAEEAGRPISAEQRAELLALDLEMWTDMNLPMLAWVKLLHRAGIKTGILSNMGDAMAEGIRRKFDWIGDFHHAVWSHALLLRKPEPAIYTAAANGLGVPPAHILFIDDKEENIRAAERCGMQGIVYRDHAAFEEEMKQRGFAALLEAEPANMQS